MTVERSNRIFEALKESKGYREAFVREHIATGIAFQIREMREAHPWTQAQLGQQIDRPQEWISALENPDKGSYTLRTLERIAAAFDVGLAVRFVPFSELVRWTVDLSPERLVPPSFENDQLPLTASLDLSALLASASTATVLFDSTDLYVGSLATGSALVGPLMPQPRTKSNDAGRSNQYALAA
jgi:transcriptional regulator with XRE-family HTH domain